MKHKIGEDFSHFAILSKYDVNRIKQLKNIINTVKVLVFLVW